MASRKARPTLADYVAIAICPALIIALVVSLVFFLLEVLYVGQYAGRLQWIFFSFVFAAVLIARMSMQDMADRAPLYGAVLAIVVAIALHWLVQYPEDSPLYNFRWLVNLGLMALIWWCAHRLTWDCTFIDENVDTSGAGLLEVAGLEATVEQAGSSEEVPVAVVDQRRQRRRDKGRSALENWWQRYQLYRKRQRTKPHSPGVWIIYFSLAALPLFGLGQSLIPPDQIDRRRYVFWLMAIYVGSGLGLLLTTSFIGLRRYLRQRKLQMPVPMTGVWLTIGAVMILALLVVGALLPRPDAEYPLVQVSSLWRSPQPEASRHSLTGGSPARGQGGAASNQPSGQNAQSSGPGNQRDSQAQSSTPGQSQQGSSQGQSRSGQGGQQSGKGQSNDQSNQPAQKGNSDHDQSKGEDKKPEEGEQNTPKDDVGRKSDHRQDQQQSKAEKTNESRGQGSSITKGFLPPSISSLLHSLGALLKWIVFAIVALIVGFIVLRAVLKFLANFTNWAKDLLAALQGLWQALFGWWLPSARPAKTVQPVEEPVVLLPFSSYRNPFWDGADSYTTPEEVVRYSFEALQAWGREHGIARETGETPLEFSSRLGMDVPTLESDARRLAALYARAAYARARLPVSCLGTVRQFWQRLEEADQAPLPT
jgi:hypothetical protein